MTLLWWFRFLFLSLDLLLWLLSCLQLFCDPVEYSPPGSSAHGNSQAAILEWVAISFTRGVFPTLGLNLYLLYWQADSLPLSHLRSPSLGFVVIWLLSYLQPHGVQHTRPPCPSPSPRVPKFTVTALVMPSTNLILGCPLLLLPLIFPASGTFPMSHLFTSDDQNTRTSASALVLLVNIQD